MLHTLYLCNVKSVCPLYLDKAGKIKTIYSKPAVMQLGSVYACRTQSLPKGQLAGNQCQDTQFPITCSFPKVTCLSKDLHTTSCHVLFLFFFFFFRASRAACGRPPARRWIRAVAAGVHHSHSHAGSEPCLHLHHSSRQGWILNALSEARDQTHILMDTSRIPSSLTHSRNSHVLYLRSASHSACIVIYLFVSASSWMLVGLVTAEHDGNSNTVACLLYRLLLAFCAAALDSLSPSGHVWWFYWVLSVLCKYLQFTSFLFLRNLC